ncbi:MAG: hypothetical protein LBL00_07950 [Endomicrobium sp.]|jgi:hypothetical protein|nr:hypothetical protein [Endomicrobium sp.]
MKKIFLLLFLCFSAVNAYALTAKEVYEKSLESNFSRSLSDMRGKSYAIEYTVKISVSDAQRKEMEMESYLLYKHFVNGNKERLDITSVDAKRTDKAMSYSIIDDGVNSYISFKVQVGANGEQNFIDYKVLTNKRTDIMDIKAIDKIVKDEGVKNNKKTDNKTFDDLSKYYEFVFDKNTPKNSKNYVVKHLVKDKKKIIKEIYDKNEKGEKISVSEQLVVLGALYDNKYSISKDRYLKTGFETARDEEIIKYLDEMQPDKEKTSKENTGTLNFGAKSVYSDYKEIEGTGILFPYLVNFQVVYGSQTTVYEMKTESFKIADGKDMDSVFVPTNTKRGKASAPEEVTVPASADWKHVRDELRKEVIKDLKQSVREQIKDESRRAAKESAKSVTKGIIKGLGGF